LTDHPPVFESRPPRARAKRFGVRALSSAALSLILERRQIHSSTRDQEANRHWERQHLAGIRSLATPRPREVGKGAKVRDSTAWRPYLKRSGDRVVQARPGGLGRRAALWESPIGNGPTIVSSMISHRKGGGRFKRLLLWFKTHMKFFRSVQLPGIVLPIGWRAGEKLDLGESRPVQIPAPKLPVFQKTEMLPARPMFRPRLGAPWLPPDWQLFLEASGAVT